MGQDWPGARKIMGNIDSSQAHGALLNSRMAYVSVSRAQFDVRIYTNDARTIGQELSRDVTMATALSPQELGEKVTPKSVGIELPQGLAVGQRRRAAYLCDTTVTMAEW
jgi:hypothetical protein